MLNWLHGNQDVYSLIAQKNYPRALAVLEHQLRSDPGSVHLRQLLADVLARMGNTDRTLAILEPLIDELAADGFEAKAIAILKKIQRIAPERSDIDVKLAALMDRDRATDSAPPKPQIEAPLPEAGVAAVPPAANRPKVQPPATRSRSEVEISTSEFVADWFDAAVARRKDFHWSPLLTGISQDERAALIGGLRLLVKKPGAIIYCEDEPGESMFILAHGLARLYRKNNTGCSQQVHVLREGDFFGEASLLTGSDRISTITAATECELLELDRETFERIAEKHPRVRRMLQHLYEKRTSFETVGLDPS